MIKALIRFVLFEIPAAFICGIGYILFEKVEITGINVEVRKQWKPDIKKQILINYLNECYKQVHKNS